MSGLRTSATWWAQPRIIGPLNLMRRVGLGGDGLIAAVSRSPVRCGSHTPNYLLDNVR